MLCCSNATNFRTFIIVELRNGLSFVRGFEDITQISVIQFIREWERQVAAVKTVAKLSTFAKGNNLASRNFPFPNAIIVVYGKNAVCVHNVENF